LFITGEKTKAIMFPKINPTNTQALASVKKAF
jgi:hypothetical protein